MFDLVGLLHELVSSPWLWLVVFAVATLDALLPFMPSETTVVIVGVLIAPDPVRLALLVITAAAGAFAGDTISYVLGRRSGPRVLARIQRTERGRRAQSWAQQQLGRRGRLLIVFARYVPAGRFATMATAGALGFAPRWYLPPELLGVALWGTQAALIGFLGGSAFQDQPLLGMAASYSVVVGAVLVAGLVRALLTRSRHRRRARPAVAGRARRGADQLSRRSCDQPTSGARRPG
ncbi:hypothetical protein GCM10010174_85630 [Kutzneria viridogrisea]|uniref:VTT domain-containing protein n=2 Tax=Kutzneria TaxID=43356 RepID=W5WMF4_9PSEU|nr:DedA family protein [Kutzneria albida]AHI01961.1 hypothetical protein KALB_8604 [Kutzneria albida DSM 43870]MBA8929616.1 membrane protein DedA with SNARE-associated domain [Kutzneria viridogrisea]